MLCWWCLWCVLCGLQSCRPCSILAASVHPREPGEPCGEPCGESKPDGVTPLLQLFKGKFYHCLGVDIRNITNRSDCVAANYKWVHHKYNFDNLGQVSLPTAPPSDGNPTQGLSPPQGTDAVPGRPMPGPEGAVIWHGCPCRSSVTGGLVSE